MSGGKYMLCRGTEFENVVMLCGGYKWQGPIDIFFSKWKHGGSINQSNGFLPLLRPKKCN
jgi:hypothetical protein